MFSCPTCKKKFSSNATLAYHKLSHSGQRPFKCFFCPNDYKSSFHRRDHEKTKHPNEYKRKLNAANVNQDNSSPRVVSRNPNRKKVNRARVAETGSELLEDVYYPYCESPFMHNMGLKVHVAKVHKAQYADFQLLSEYSVSRKQISHTKNVQNSYKGDSRNTKLTTLSSPDTKVTSAPQVKPLNNHSSDENSNETSSSVQEQSKDMIFCSLCNDEFYEKLYLDVHLRDWHKENKQPKARVELDIPADRFESKRNLDVSPTTAVKITGDTSNADSSKTEILYQYSQCSKSFLIKDQLETHRALHKRRQTFSCKICGRRFLSVNEKNAHKLSAHKVAPTKTIHSEVLQKHNLTRKSSISTSDNDTESINMDGGTLHKKKEKRGKNKFDLYQCPICDYRDSTDLQLTQHVDTVHDKGGIYSCPHCGIVMLQSTDLLLHVKTHDQEKPFSCDICGLRFREREAKYKHQESHDDEIDDLISNHEL